MNTTKLRVTGINHVVLHVTDVDASKRFYMEVLGFEDRGVSAGSSTRASFLRCGAQGLDLFEIPGDDAHGGEEMNHMALCVAADDLDEIVAVLAGIGVESSERTPRNTVFISDPDGHRIEILPLSASERAAEREAARNNEHDS
jgi:catechol 2,3-dioxygenase-like lactoylglutathione lyase family enzyme